MPFIDGADPAYVSKFKPIYDMAYFTASAIANKAGIDFYKITEIRFYTEQEEINHKESAVWAFNCDNRTVQIKINKMVDAETLTHEIGHSLFHPSPLHARHYEDPKYGDRFCNAFRFYLHPEKGLEWMPNDDSQYDAHTLIKKCPDLASFTTYFVSLCNKKRQEIAGRGQGKPTRILDLEGI